MIRPPTCVGRSRSAVTNLLRLLDLPPPVRELLQQGKLDMGHARALLALVGMQQIEAARSVVAKNLSVRETEKLVGQLLRGTPGKKARKTDRTGMFCACRKSWPKSSAPKCRSRPATRAAVRW